MRKAGIREARQHLSALIEDVRKGRENLITERGRPVARLVPAAEAPGPPFPDLLAPVQSRCHVLVTGDQTHFGSLDGRGFRGVEVLPPVDALARLLR